MALFRQELFEEIRDLTNEKIERQGFLTSFDINKIWSDARRRRFISLNIFGFPEDESKATQTSFLEKRLKLVLILIDIHWPHLIGSCYRLNHTHTDENLPLKERGLGFLKPSYKNNFQVCQWRYIPPIIKERQKIQIFEGQINLPFDTASRRPIGSGMSGGRDSVFRESIPAGYYQDLNKNLNTVSIYYSKICSEH